MRKKIASEKAMTDSSDIEAPTMTARIQKIWYALSAFFEFPVR